MGHVLVIKYSNKMQQKKFKRCEYFSKLRQDAKLCVFKSHCDHLNCHLCTKGVGAEKTKNRWGGIEFTRGESFLCMSRVGASSAPHSMNLARALALSRLRSGVLSWPGRPGEGYLQPPPILARRESLVGGMGRSWNGKRLGGSRNWHVLELWNLQVEHSNVALKENICSCVSQRPAEEDAALSLRVKSKASVPGEDESYYWSRLAGAGNVWTKNNTKFMDQAVSSLRQYFPSILFGWPNIMYSKFIKHSVIPADLKGV